MQVNNPITPQGGINPRTKAYLQIGLFIGVAYVIYKVIKKEVEKQKILREMGNMNTITNNELGNTGGIVLQTQCQAFNPAPAAEALRDAMEDNCAYIFTCTDEEKIWNTLEGLDCDQRKCVRQYFNMHYGEGETLFQWFEGDLSGSDLARAKGYFDCDYVMPEEYL